MNLLKITNKTNLHEAVDALILTLLTILIFINCSLMTIFIMVNITILSFVGIYGTRPKNVGRIIFSCIAIGLSCFFGSLTYSYHMFHVILFISYSGLVFYLSKYDGIFKTPILTNTALMFLIYSGVPFTKSDLYKYPIGTIIITLLFLIFYYIRNKIDSAIEPKSKQEKKAITPIRLNRTHIHKSTIVVISLILAYMLARLLSKETFFLNQHNYWIPLTILVVIRDSYRQILSTTLRRILVNIIGAIIAVCLFTFVIPDSQLFIFLFTIIVMFLIFLCGSSYILLVLFIELFIFGMAMFLNEFNLNEGVERVVDTFIGGGIVFLVTYFHVLIYRYFEKKYSDK